VAVNLGKLEVVKLLLKAGADVNYRDLGGRTALDVAVNEGTTEMEKLLRAAGGKEGEKPKGAGR
jgi:ankyrin repeat protein